MPPRNPILTRPSRTLSAAHQRYQAAPLPHMQLAAKTDDVAVMQEQPEHLGGGDACSFSGTGQLGELAQGAGTSVAA